MTPTKKKTVFLGNFSQKGGRGGGPTLGKNSQKIPLFFFGSVPKRLWTKMRMIQVLGFQVCLINCDQLYLPDLQEDTFQKWLRFLRAEVQVKKKMERQRQQLQTTEVSFHNRFSLIIFCHFLASLIWSPPVTFLSSFVPSCYLKSFFVIICQVFITLLSSFVISCHI